jgi:hypothetical protein
VVQTSVDRGGNKNLYSRNGAYFLFGACRWVLTARHKTTGNVKSDHSSIPPCEDEQ